MQTTLNIRDDGQIHMDAINLEGCTESELETIATHPAIHADVQQMAKLIISARTYRAAGNIERATRFERKADHLYETLPTALRW